MKKLIGCLLTPIFLVVWLLLLNVFHLLQILALKLSGPGGHRRTVDWLNFFLLSALWLLATRSSVRFAEPLPSGRPLIIVANHQNKLDISGIGWFLRRHAPRYVSKVELARGIPSVSYNLRHSGAALIDRSDARQSLREIGRLGKLIAVERCAAVIFPEGTRSLTGKIAPFQSAGVKILLKNAPEALVVPVYIHDTWKLNRWGSFPMSVGERLSWTVLRPIDPAGKSPDEVVSLAEALIRQEQNRQNAA